MEDRARAGGAPALAQFRPLVRDRVGPVDEGRHGGRQLDEPGVVAALVQGCFRVEEGAGLLGLVVVLGVGRVVADEEGVAVVAGLLGLVDLVVAAGAARAVVARVRADLAPVDVARLRVDAQAPGVAGAHREDLGPGLRRAGLEEVAFGDRVGAVVMHADTVHLADEGIGVGRGALAVERLLTRPLVERREALAVAEGAGVVAGREIQATIGPELQGGAVVAAGEALFLVLEDDLLAPRHQLVVLDGEAGKVLAVETERRVDEVDPTVLGELRVEREGQEAVLLLLEGFDLGDERDALRLRVVDLERPGVFVQPDAAVGAELEVHGLRHPFEQLLDLEADVLRGLGGPGGRSKRQHGGGEQVKGAYRVGSHGEVTLGKGGGSRRFRKIPGRARGEQMETRTRGLEDTRAGGQEDTRAGGHEGWRAGVRDRKKERPPSGGRS